MKKGANLFGPDATGTGQSQDSAHHRDLENVLEKKQNSVLQIILIPRYLVQIPQLKVVIVLEGKKSYLPTLEIDLGAANHPQLHCIL